MKHCTHLAWKEKRWGPFNPLNQRSQLCNEYWNKCVAVLKLNKILVSILCPGPGPLLCHFCFCNFNIEDKSFFKFIDSSSSSCSLVLLTGQLNYVFSGPPRHLTTRRYVKAASGTPLSTDYILFGFSWVFFVFFDNLASIRPSASLQFFNLTQKNPQWASTCLKLILLILPH